MMMPGAELRDTLKTLGLSQVAAAQLLEKNGRTIRRWVQDGINNDPVSAILLRLLAKRAITVEDIDLAKEELGKKWS